MHSERAHTAAFSGHRSFKTRDGQELIAARVRGAILRLMSEGYDTFLTGMAEGFDLLAAREVLVMRETHPELRLIAVVPFASQAARFAKATRAEYDKVLAAADHVVTLSGGYDPGCFHRRNDFLLDNASALICHYNGSPGGTRYCVTRAARQGLRILHTTDMAAVQELF